MLLDDDGLMLYSGATELTDGVLTTFVRCEAVDHSAVTGLSLCCCCAVVERWNVVVCAIIVYGVSTRMNIGSLLWWE